MSDLPPDTVEPHSCGWKIRKTTTALSVGSAPQPELARLLFLLSWRRIRLTARVIYPPDDWTEWLSPKTADGTQFSNDVRRAKKAKKAKITSKHPHQYPAPPPHKRLMRSAAY